MALKRIGAKFEHYRVVEFDKYAIASYNAVHGTNFPTMDITNVHAEDMIKTMNELEKENIHTDFLYEKDGEKGYWLEIL